MFLLFILTCVLKVYVLHAFDIKESEGCTTVILNNTYTWQSANPYTNGECVIVEAEEGYIVLVTVNWCDIAGNDGDYLLIKHGTSINEGGTGRIFTYNLNTERQYLVQSNVVYLNFEVNGANEDERAGAAVTFERFGEQITTTTASPTTGISWPTPTGNESIYLTVYLYGKSASDYSNNVTLNAFKNAVVDMAMEYCSVQNTPLTDNITILNVHVLELTQCPYYWPDQELCVKIQFAVPVFIDEDDATWSGYQLNTFHLQEMWSSLSGHYLDLYRLAEYQQPDHDYMMLIWSLSLLAVILVFSVILFIIRYVTLNLSSSEKVSIDDASSVTSKHRDSNLSLTPHPLQSTPQLFENDYPMYEPGFSPPPYGEYAAENQGMSDDEYETDEEPNIVHFRKYENGDSET